MKRPKLACCNFIEDIHELRAFALANGFDGIDWTVTQESLPQNPLEETLFVKKMAFLYPLEVRYHCAFKRIDPGDVDPVKAQSAIKLFQRICRLVSKARGRFLTIHVGLGRSSTFNLSWERTIQGLSRLVQFANGMAVRLCLENLSWGWTSRPELYEKLLRKSGAWATLDIGHARVSPYIQNQHYRLEDFVVPHPERFLSAHIYHEEKANRHLPAIRLEQIAGRLEILRQLESCDWWVLELRNEHDLMMTLKTVRDFLG